MNNNRHAIPEQKVAFVVKVFQMTVFQQRNRYMWVTPLEKVTSINKTDIMQIFITSGRCQNSALLSPKINNTQLRNTNSAYDSKGCHFMPVEQINQSILG
jgi:hypothetical protein